MTKLSEAAVSFDQVTKQKNYNSDVNCHQGNLYIVTQVRQCISLSTLYSVQYLDFCIMCLCVIFSGL